MRNVIKTKTLGLLILFLFSQIGVFSQLHRTNDLSLWTWVQFHKDFGKHQYFEFQYQLRLRNNMTTFDRSNFYFLYGYNISKKLTAEALYQFATNHQKDQHTFYTGLTYRVKLSKHFSAFFRTAYQYTRLHLSTDGYLDNPYSEWRNRIRVHYKLTKQAGLAFSAEPYLKISYKHSPYISRIRFVTFASYKLNKYQSITAFYLIEPDFITYSRPKNDFAIGLTYHIDLPNKLKKMGNLFKIKLHKKKNEDDDGEVKDGQTFL